MIVRLMAAGVLAVTAVAAQTYATRAWFPDGAGVEIHAETTGSTQQTELQGGGTMSDERTMRFMLDSHGKTVFAYGLDARKAESPDAVTIRIEPLGHGDTTVSAVREFPAVRIGQEVKIEILSNPTTGERVFDVLRPIERRRPPPGYHSIEGVDIPKLVVNGQTRAVKSDWGGSDLPRLYVPGRGAYYLSWASRPKYRLAGYLEKNRLIFLMDGIYVEMTFVGNVLRERESGPVWVYRDPAMGPADQGGASCSLDSYR
jgi:hypothetical protein